MTARWRRVGSGSCCCNLATGTDGCKVCVKFNLRHTPGGGAGGSGSITFVVRRARMASARALRCSGVMEARSASILAS